MKSCVLTWTLVCDEPKLYTFYFDKVLSILLKAKNDLWISWKCGLVRATGLKFLAEAYLTRIIHSRKFQPKRTILDGKSNLCISHISNNRSNVSPTLWCYF